MRKRRKCGKVSWCTTISRNRTFYVMNRLILTFFFKYGDASLVEFLLRLIFFTQLYKKPLNSLSTCELISVNEEALEIKKNKTSL